MLLFLIIILLLISVGLGIYARTDSYQAVELQSVAGPFEGLDGEGKAFANGPPFYGPFGCGCACKRTRNQVCVCSIPKWISTGVDSVVRL